MSPFYKRYISFKKQTFFCSDLNSGFFSPQIQQCTVLSRKHSIFRGEPHSLKLITAQSKKNNTHCFEWKWMKVERWDFVLCSLVGAQGGAVSILMKISRRLYTLTVLISVECHLMQGWKCFHLFCVFLRLWWMKHPKVRGNRSIYSHWENKCTVFWREKFK